MKLRMSKQWIITTFVAIVIILAGLLLWQYNNSVSRRNAEDAAAGYMPVAHEYVSKVADKLAPATSKQTSSAESFAYIEDVVSFQQEEPKLAKVSGPGAKLASYTAAQHYQAKVSALDKSLRDYETQISTYKPYSDAYISLFHIMNDVEAGKLGGGGTAAFSQIVIQPITVARTAFAKVRVTNAYKQTAADVNTAFKGYLAAAEQQNLRYDFDAPLQVVYKDVVAFAQALNTQGETLANQAKVLTAE